MRRRKHKFKRRKRKWYPKYIDKQCLAMMKEVKRLARKVSTYPYNQTIRNLYYGKRKALKSLIKKNEKTMRNKLIENLNNLYDKNPQEYWNVLKQLQELNDRKQSGPEDDIEIDEWRTHFESLLVTKWSKKNNEEHRKILAELETLKSLPTYNELDFIITGKELGNALKSSINISEFF